MRPSLHKFYWFREDRNCSSELFPDARLGRWHDQPVGPHLAAMYQVEGWICDRTHSYEWVLGGAGLFPLLALGAIFVLWPPWREPLPPPPPEPEGDRNIS